MRSVYTRTRLTVTDGPLVQIVAEFRVLDVGIVLGLHVDFDNACFGREGVHVLI